jgi:hypothetical protein
MNLFYLHPALYAPRGIAAILGLDFRADPGSPHIGQFLLGGEPVGYVVQQGAIKQEGCRWEPSPCIISFTSKVVVPATFAFIRGQ